MLIKILFGTSIILAGLFLALPETLASVTTLGSEPYTVSRLVGIAAVIFEAWWIVKKLRGV